MGSGQTPTPAPQPAAADAFPVTVSDSQKRMVTLPGKPLRIVSAAPANTELLFAVGAGDQVVGVTTYCNYPPEAKTRAKIGGFSASAISMEKIVALKPDLVCMTGGIQMPLLKQMENVGLTVLVLNPKSLEETAAALELVGTATGHTREAQAAATRFRQRLAKAEVKPGKDPLRVFYLLSEEPLMSAGRNTFLDELISRAGAKNIFGDAAQQFPRVSEEELLNRDPQVVLTPRRGNSEARRAAILARPTWRELSAVKAGRIVFLDEDTASRAGPRLAEALEELVKALRSQ